MSRKLFVAGLITLFVSCWALAADQTWNGKISDSKCNAKHVSTAEHKGAKMDDAACVEKCVKDGAKYVFVSRGKVYEIANQDLAGLAQHAGHTVKVTGTMSGNTVTISKLEMPGKKM